MAYTLQDGDNAETRITWDDGVLHSASIDLTKSLIKMAKKTWELTGPMGGPYATGSDIIKDGAAFYFFYKRLFPEVEVVDGELPALEALPDEGAIP